MASHSLFHARRPEAQPGRVDERQGHLGNRLMSRLRRARPRWTPGNRIELLENGEQYFPQVFAAIEQARSEVVIETFILFEDKVGIALQQSLLKAAARGVAIDLLVDGYGSPDLSDTYLGTLKAAGVRVRAFDPRPRLFGLLRTNVFRRMHRKIVVVDGEVAFVGGINFSADHLADYGPTAKQDYAVRLQGPIVAQIRAFARKQIATAGPLPPTRPMASAGDADVMFVIRDNRYHRDDIERHYRAAIRMAKRDVIIANAYFFPGYRLLKTISQAARRGVRVRLILQGQPDMPIVKMAAGLLHSHLLPAGVEIHEYCKRPLHGKVAVVDDAWATVGSSNLDPLSLALNLEANVMTRDIPFIGTLRGHLETLMREECTRVEVTGSEKRGRWFVLLDTLAYHVTRWFPSWAGWLPAHRPRLKPLEPSRSLTVAGDAEPEPAREEASHAGIRAAR